MDLDALLEREARSSRQSHPVLRQIGLVAIGAKPVATRSFVVDASGQLTFGFGNDQWDARNFLAALAASCGCTVIYLARPQNNQVTAIVSRDELLAQKTAAILAEIDASHGTETEKQADELRGLFGYPRSSLAAYLDREVRAAPARLATLLAAEDRPFIECAVPAEPHAMCEAVVHFRQLGQSFREALPRTASVLKASTPRLVAARRQGMGRIVRTQAVRR